MSKRIRTRAWSESLALILLAPPHLAAAPGGAPPPAPGPIYARDPDVGASAIFFVSGDDLWTVPREGGVARRVAAGAGPKRRPKLSPDGATIAFTGSHDALYTVPVAGGEPTRITHHPGATDLCDWTPDGRLLFMTDAFSHLFDADGQARIRQLFTVAAGGGLPERIGLPYGANGALAGDGAWLAYTFYAEGRGEARARHLGGNAPDVWLLNLRTRASRKITEWEGTDTAPMWHGRAVYYLSDAGPERRLNLWSFDTTDGTRRQLTRYADFDVKWPSVGPGPLAARVEGEIVFSHGARLGLLDLATGEARDVEVRLPADAAAPAEQTFDAAKRIERFAPAPDGSLAALEARGDVWVVGGPGVAPRNLTNSAAAAERDPSWSPDGRWVAYFSDASGEYELWVNPADGSPRARRLSEIGSGLGYRPAWSPDSRSIAFSDSTGALYLASLESGRSIRFDLDPLVREPRIAWSPDSAWIAYSRGAEGSTRSTAIWLYDVAAGSARQVTSGWFSDDSPVFDRAGEYLYFVSARNLWDAVVFDSVDDGNFIYPSADLVMAVPLRRGIASPWSPRRGPAPQARAGEHVRIDFEGFEHRGVAILADPGDYGSLAVAADGRLLYTFAPPSGATSIRFADFEKGRATDAPETATVLEGVDAFELAADGGRLLARSGEALAFVDAAPSRTLEPALTLSGMTVRPDARAEWGQLFRDTWRRYRDLFYDPGMRGVDWTAMRAKYEPLLAACRSREDVYAIIGDMIAELGSSHAKVAPPSDEEPESTGVLCVDFELRDGAYRIAKIHDGSPADTRARNPLRRPGVEVAEGEYLLAVDGTPLDPKVDPWAPFVGLASKSVTITVGPNPRIDAAARQVVVTPRRSEPLVRNRAWVEVNRVAVDRASGGRVGYIYLATTETYGSSEFTRQLAGQLDKEALVVDVRWNQGGFHPFHVVDVLARPRYLYFTISRRAAGGGRIPDYILEGPSCMLTNEIAYSGGDGLPYYFRKRGVGKLIGSRTLGGKVGVRIMPFLIDGGELLVPEEGSYESSDAWAVEGHGVEPDIVVRETPTELAEGRDPQLEAAVRHLLKELEGHQRPARPRPPGH